MIEQICTPCDKEDVQAKKIQILAGQKFLEACPPCAIPSQAIHPGILDTQQTKRIITPLLFEVLDKTFNTYNFNTGFDFNPDKNLPKY